LRNLENLISRQSFKASKYFASVDGVRVDPASISVSVWDPSFLRGDGVFEGIRIVNRQGKMEPRAVQLHLDRLVRSAESIALELPDRNLIERWIREACLSAGDEKGYIRLVVTRGAGAPGYGEHLGECLIAPRKTIILWQPIAPGHSTTPRTLAPIIAPFHPAGLFKQWNTVKYLSYGANLHATRLARAAGAQDALLLARGWNVADDDECLERRVVLDGPQFGVGWITKSGVLELPDWRQLGMLESITSTVLVQAAMHLGIPVNLGVFTLDHLLKNANELWLLSTTTDLCPIRAIAFPETSSTNNNYFHLPVVDHDGNSSPFRSKLLEAMALIESRYDKR